MVPTLALLLVVVGNDEELEQLLRWHEATLASIRSISCDVELTKRNLRYGSEKLCRGRYRAKGDLQKITEFGDDGFQQIWVHREGKCYSFGTRPGVAAMGIRAEKDADSFFHLKGYLGIEVNYPLSLRHHTLAELLRLAKGKPRLETKNNLVIIHARFPGLVSKSVTWNTQINLDKDRGCWITSIRDEGAAPESVLKELTLSDFKEFPGGLYFPAQIDGRITVNGECRAHNTWKLSNLAINAEIPDGEFQVNFPANAMVWDSIRGTRYQVDAQGQRIGPEITEPPAVVGPGAVQLPAAGKPGQPSTHDAGSLWSYLPLAAGSLCASLIFFWLWKRYRA